MEPRVIINIVLILLVAWVLGDLFQRLRMPRLLGELLAGLVLGPPLLGWVQPREAMTVLSDLGIFFLMFYSGMEMDPRKLLEHFWVCLAVAIGGFAVPFALGFAVALWFGATMLQSLFMAMGLSVTALAVGARVLQDMEIHQSKVGHIIIGAAIVDDMMISWPWFPFRCSPAWPEPERWTPGKYCFCWGKWEPFSGLPFWWAILSCPGSQGVSRTRKPRASPSP